MNQRQNLRAAEEKVRAGKLKIGVSRPDVKDKAASCDESDRTGGTAGNEGTEAKETDGRP